MMAIPEREFPSRRFFTRSVYFLMAYFGLRLLFFALVIPPFGPPDEITHFGCSRIFSQVLLLPKNSPESYPFGLVTNIPWLYYWIMGKLLHLNFFGLPDLLFLRLLNIPFAFGTVFYVWRTFRLLTEDRLGQLLLLVAVTNTLMFTFLSASVSYDNLTNLLAAMAAYYLFAFFKERSGGLLAASLACQLAGCLTKNTLLPLVLVLNVLLLVYEFRNLRAFPAALVSWLRTLRWRGLVAVALILMAFALNIQLYGGNYLHYEKLAPEMSDVLPRDIAMQNRIAARGMIFTLFKEGKVTREQALTLTSQMESPSDRDDTATLIDNHESILNGRIQMVGLPAYMQLWVYNIIGTVYGVKCQMGMLPEHLWVVLSFLALTLLSGVGFLVRWRPGKNGWLAPCLAVSAGFYLVFLLYAVCYQAYLYYEQPGLALQGRYIFPVIGPLYAFMCYYLLSLFSNPRVRLGAAAVAALLFLACDLPLFLAEAPRDWFIFWAG